MASENIKATYAWLKAQGFMHKSESDIEAIIRKRGLSDGNDAGSWVIDGNTSKETARTIFDGIEAGDPAILDGLPELQLGQWADDPSFREILSDEGIECDEDSEDDYWQIYADAWSEGMLNRVTRDARLAMPMRVKLSPSDDDDGMVTVYCEDQEQAKHDGVISLEGQGARWECPGDMECAYATLCDFYDLAAALTEAGYEVDDSEYSAPTDEDLRYWSYKNECENSGEDPLDRDEWLAQQSAPLPEA